MKGHHHVKDRIHRAAYAVSSDGDDSRIRMSARLRALRCNQSALLSRLNAWGVSSQERWIMFSRTRVVVLATALLLPLIALGIWHALVPQNDKHDQIDQILDELGYFVLVPPSRLF